MLYFDKLNSYGKEDSQKLKIAWHSVIDWNVLRRTFFLIFPIFFNVHNLTTKPVTSRTKTHPSRAFLIDFKTKMPFHHRKYTESATKQMIHNLKAFIDCKNTHTHTRAPFIFRRSFEASMNVSRCDYTLFLSHFQSIFQNEFQLNRLHCHLSCHRFWPEIPSTALQVLHFSSSTRLIISVLWP